MNIQKRIEDLRRNIAHHNHLYYQEVRPEITDREYDQLYLDLILLEKAYPEYFSANSPTQKMGSTPTQGFKEGKHIVPMLSLDNTYSEKDIRVFQRKILKLLDIAEIDYVVEPKIDGVSISLHYQDGKLISAITRGNGNIGDDVTENVKTIQAIPERLTNKVPFMEIRGEIFFPKHSFYQLNQTRKEQGKTLFSNPRNAAAGTLKLLDARKVAMRPLDAVFYGCGARRGIQINSQQDLLLTLQELGLTPPAYFTCCSSVDKIISVLQDLEQKRTELPYELDGAVIKVNKFSYHALLGTTVKAPRWAIAYKFTSLKAITKINDISLQVGRTGVITPVAELEPVLISGTIVRRATLHNFAYIKRKSIEIGDEVEIEKAGEIIPHVIRSLRERGRKNEPAFGEKTWKCPSCKQPVTLDPQGVFLRCTNPHCPEQIKERIKHFASKKAMDIATLGPALTEIFVKHKIVSTPADLYRLSPKQIRFLKSHPGLGEKSVIMLLRGIEKSKKNPPERLLFGLGIHHVGAAIAQTLIEHFHDIEKLVTVDTEALMKIKGIGRRITESIVSYFHNPEHLSMLHLLKESSLILKKKPVDKQDHQSSFFAGKRCVFTGTLQSASREKAKELLLSQGGKVNTAISSNTDYLIIGINPGLKLEKAKKTGVSILPEKIFWELLHSIAGYI